MGSFEPGSAVVTSALADFAGTGHLTTCGIDPQTGRTIRQRHTRVPAAYQVARRAGLTGLVRRFGLTAGQFADNLADQYARHEVDQCPMLPNDAAADFFGSQFETSHSALAAARYMLAFEISREPVVRRAARRLVASQASIRLTPTAKGVRDIDENHPLYSVKYLHDKPVSDLMADPIFLHIHNGVRAKLITFEIYVPETRIRGFSLLEDWQRLFHRDEFSALVQAWNDQRNLVLKQAIDEMIFPFLFKEQQRKLLESSQQKVVKARIYCLCAQKLFDFLKVAPFSPDGYRGTGQEGDPDDPSGLTGGGSPSHHRCMGGDSSLGTGAGKRQVSGMSGAVWPRGARVLALALKDADGNRQGMVSAVQLDVHGEVVDFIHLHHLLAVTRGRPEAQVSKASCRFRLYHQMALAQELLFIYYWLLILI
ncbi:unnamed protein product [Protopolystoma xenopodis]|uniref:Uncharacterized protein n=1 Tax=Protopolystoma xenopodis TaxID=117903 RepID=A0A3S5A5S8_9PLAT|nr:unnamed protein product [Protopolystoma xenopodis]